MRVECWVRTSVSAHPKGCCCGVYKGTPLPTHPLHPKGCCCGVYKGTTSPHTPQGLLLWGLQRYYLSPHTPRDAAVGFTEVLPLPTHPKGWCCGVYRGTTSPTHPKGCCCGVYKSTTSPHTPSTPHLLTYSFFPSCPPPPTLHPPFFYLFLSFFPFVSRSLFPFSSFFLPSFASWPYTRSSFQIYLLGLFCLFVCLLVRCVCALNGSHWLCVRVTARLAIGLTKSVVVHRMLARKKNRLINI